MWYLFAHWVGEHKYLTSWIQLVSPVIGLIVAIAVPSFMRRRNLRKRRVDTAVAVMALVQVFQTLIDATDELKGQIEESHNPDQNYVVVILINIGRYEALWEEISTITLSAMPNPDVVSKLVDCKHYAEDLILSVREIKQDIDNELITRQLHVDHLVKTRNDLAVSTEALRKCAANITANK